jgi:hypothetical protein
MRGVGKKLNLTSTTFEQSDLLLIVLTFVLLCAY